MKRKLQAFVLACAVLFVLLFLPLVVAVDYWDNAVNLYPNATTRWDGVREIENAGSNPLDVRVEYFDSSNISVFKICYLSGNGTNFVTIENGVVTKSEDTVRLQSQQKLVFDIEAQPLDSATQGQTASVTVQITRTEVEANRPSAITIFPNFDLKIVVIPSYIVRLWSPETKIDVQLKNLATIDVETKLSFWVENALNETTYKETLTVLVLKSETKIIAVSIPTPSDIGEYSFHVKVIDPNVIASAQKAFKVYNLLEWLLNEGSIVLFLLIAVPTAGIVAFLVWATNEDKWSEWF